jgi:uncharacterized DUF497 family protein
MYGGPVVWDDVNRRHLTTDHPERRISVDEVEQVLEDPGRRERHDSRNRSYVVIGATATGRLLVVAYVIRRRGRYPIHARQAGARARREYTP